MFAEYLFYEYIQYSIHLFYNRIAFEVNYNHLLNPITEYDEIFSTNNQFIRLELIRSCNCIQHTLWEIQRDNETKYQQMILWNNRTLPAKPDVTVFQPFQITMVTNFDV